MSADLFEYFISGAVVHIHLDKQLGIISNNAVYKLETSVEFLMLHVF